MFKKYPKIENHYNEKFISKIQEKFSDLKYFITEKIDGMNLCFDFKNHKFLGVYTRSGMNFELYDSYQYYISFIENLKNKLLNNIGFDNFKVYGELYGNHIQHKLYYSSNTNPHWCDFKFFDIYLDNENRFLNFNELENFRFGNFGKNIVPVLSKNISLEEALNFEIENLYSTVSEKQTLVEGIIIRPVIEQQLTPQDRLIIKKKTKRNKELFFIEDLSKMKINRFDLLITGERLKSVMSKQEYKLPYDKHKLINDFLNDSIEEYEKIIGVLNKDEKKFIRKKYSQMVWGMISKIY